MIPASAPLTLDTRTTRLAPEPLWDDAAAVFARTRHLRLPGLLAPDLFAWLTHRLESSRFRTRVARDVTPPAVDLKLVDDVVHGLMHLLLNDPPVVRWMRRVSGAQAITGFVGAVYRLEPGRGHRDSWHSDVDGNRLVGLSINLSRGMFEGGELAMRDRASGRVLWHVANTGPGDGLLFAIHPSLQHRIRPVTGHQPKTAMAGWFCIDPDDPR